MAWFYKEENNKIICTVKEDQELLFFVPENYFGSKSAVIDGDIVSLLGVFNYAIYKDNKPVSELKIFKFPSIFLTKPHTIDKWKDITLTKETGKKDYRVLRYRAGDVLVEQLDIPKQVANVEEFIRLWIVIGNIPNIDYRLIWRYILENAKLNDLSYKISNQVIGVFQTEVCRDIKDPYKPFRLSKEKKDGKWQEYRPVSVKEVPDYISPFVSISSENFDDSVIAATMMKSNKYSPLEKVVTGK